MTWTTRTRHGLRNVHEREVPATPEEVWALMRSLGSDTDRLWPADRWPPLVLSDDLRPGSHGGHGPIRYRVEDVEPGQAVRFAFDRSNGFVGWHEFRVTPVGHGARLTHTLTIERPSPLVEIAIVPLHDALLEDLLDQLDAVVADRPVTRRPLPAPVRARLALVAAAEPPPRPSSTRRTIATATAATLGAVGALHLVWGLGSPWPFTTREQLARTVVGVPELRHPPGLPACAAVATALGVAAGAAIATTSQRRRLRGAASMGTGIAAGVLGLRGLAGLVTSAALPRRVTPEYRRLDLALYSPLCLALAGALHELRRPRATQPRTA